MTLGSDNLQWIDAHHHLWQYDHSDYPWITEDLERIRRDFLKGDLEETLNHAGIGGAIAVQARQTIEETRWLLQVASTTPLIRGVVGWAPLVDDDIADTLQALAVDKRLCGIRHILQDEPDPLYMSRLDFNRGIKELQTLGLPYDLLVRPEHLPQSIHLVDRHPQQVFILDHMAKPPIRARELEPWATQLRALAERPNVFCKLSGAVTEAQWKDWSDADLRPYLNLVLEVFTPRRIMFGSDWPVLLLASDYEEWKKIVERFFAQLTFEERQRIAAGTAVEAYQLKGMAP